SPDSPCYRGSRRTEPTACLPGASGAKNATSSHARRFGRKSSTCRLVTSDRHSTRSRRSRGASLPSIMESFPERPAPPLQQVETLAIEVTLVRSWGRKPAPDLEQAPPLLIHRFDPYKTEETRQHQPDSLGS